MEYQFILIGNPDVGKTSLARRWYYDKFYNGESPDEPEIDQLTKALSNDCRVTLTDTAGQERFRGLTTSFYRNADVVLLCFDIADKESWKDVDDWLTDSRRLAQDAILILVGCKEDLRASAAKVVERSEIKTYSEDKGFLFYMEISSKTNKNVDILFEKAVTFLIEDERYINSVRSEMGTGDVKLSAEPIAEDDKKRKFC
eukprot:TRINITY_DN5350_c0_g1_i1.p1 TRINITY_DN5350_c0_g1~~TRINITY_DN5350_c0_g1_i1.p1  ORF type:complete len:200 (+),score=32.80 TRINITY_DN5350_c0_g1_i1:87-686(+)